MPKSLAALTALVMAGSILVGVPAAGAGDVYGFAQFKAKCPFSHSARDDPIVHKKMPGMSHSHDFFGNTTTNAFSSTMKLARKPTTCRPRGDRSAYWVPSLYVKGTKLHADKATFYYTVQDGWSTDPEIQPYPRGLRMIAGDAGATEPYAGAPFTWSCQGGGDSSHGEIPKCPKGHPLELRLRFPECWDGDRRTSDDQSHVAYRDGPDCPPGYPIPFPRLEFKLRYPTNGGPDTTLATLEPERGRNAAGYTAHGDFWNAWRKRALEHRIAFCLNTNQLKCNERGRAV